jgi:hypothetical protein
MEMDVVASPEPLIDVDPVTPAPGAEEQKPADPPSDADAQKPEEVTETPEQQEARKESRRARQARRHAMELAEARTEARMLREQLKGQQPAQPESSEPKRESFDDYETYLRALTRYDAEQVASKRLDAERQARQSSEQQGKAAEGQAKAAQEWVKREKAFQEATKDYDEVVTPYVETDLGSLSDGARRLIVESDVGPQLLYKLAMDSDVQDRIAALSPVRQIAELGKLEASLAAPPKKASNAPPPVKPVGQGRSSANGFSEDMSDAAYRAMRKSQGARWAQ